MNELFKNLVILFVLVITVASCGSLSQGQEKVTEKTLFVGPEREACMGVVPQECYLIKENLEDEWELLYEEIEGFEYEEGWTYKLRVEEQTVDDPPADGSALRLILLEVVSKVKG